MMECGDGKRREHGIIKIRRAAKLLADASTLLDSASGYSDLADDAGLMARQANDLLQEIRKQKELLGH